MNLLDYPDLLPDSKTIWFFRERLSKTGRDSIIWKELQRQLDSKGIKIRIVLFMMQLSSLLILVMRSMKKQGRLVIQEDQKTERSRRRTTRRISDTKGIY
ncbi:MAG: hypothetical protein QW292_10140 [Candidatus Parvarchaeota archaeon]